MTDLSSVFINWILSAQYGMRYLAGENREKCGTTRLPELPIKTRKDLVLRVWHAHVEAVTRVAGPVSLKANSSKVIIWKKNNTLHKFQSSLQDVFLGQSYACPISRK